MTAEHKTMLRNRAKAALDSGTRASLAWKCRLTAMTTYPAAMATLSATVTHAQPRSDREPGIEPAPLNQ